MYRDYRISIGLPILKEPLNNSYNEVLKKAAGKKNSLNFDEEDIYYNLKERHDVFITNDRSSNNSICGTYVGTYYICVSKSQSNVSNFPLVLGRKELDTWDREIRKLRHVCNVLDIDFPEDNLSIIVDSENY